MKYSTLIYIGIMMFLGQEAFGQEFKYSENPSKEYQIIHLESGVNLSIPVHIMMFRTHRLAVGFNVRAWKKITPVYDLGLKFDYDYRFIKKGSQKLINPESTLKERASHNNFSLFCIKPNIQFNLSPDWYFGAESGVGYALSDLNGGIGLGFVSEFAGPQKFGLCSGIYVGKSFNYKEYDNKMSISLDFTQFLAHGHAENSLGLKYKYSFF